MKPRHLIHAALTAGLLLALGAATPGQGKKPRETVGTIERIAPAFDKLVPKDAKLEKLAEGFKWTEGPLYVPAGKYVLFSDIPNNVVNKWEEGKGITAFLNPAGYTG